MSEYYWGERKSSGISVLENWVMDYDVIKLSHHKTETSSQIVTMQQIFRNSKFLMKIKFLSYVTRKFYLYLITRKFPSYGTRKIPQLWNFIKNSELRNSRILFSSSRDKLIVLRTLNRQTRIFLRVSILGF